MRNCSIKLSEISQGCHHGYIIFLIRLWLLLLGLNRWGLGGGRVCVRKITGRLTSDKICQRVKRDCCYSIQGTGSDLSSKWKKPNVQLLFKFSVNSCTIVCNYKAICTPRRVFKWIWNICIYTFRIWFTNLNKLSPCGGTSFQHWLNKCIQKWKYVSLTHKPLYSFNTQILLRSNLRVNCQPEE